MGAAGAPPVPIPYRAAILRLATVTVTICLYGKSAPRLIDGKYIYLHDSIADPSFREARGNGFYEVLKPVLLRWCFQYVSYHNTRSIDRNL